MSAKTPANRRTAWLIGALCLAPVVASYFAYYVAPPAGHTNAGDLLETRALPDPRLRLLDGTTFQLSQLHGKWVLLVTDAAQCDSACERKLFTIRQLRLTQGKDMERIERAWLISDSAPVAAPLASNYKGMWFVRAADSDLLKQLPAASTPAEFFYIVDPLGNLVLRYPQSTEPAKMIKDLTRLLRTSRIG